MIDALIASIPMPVRVAVLVLLALCGALAKSVYSRVKLARLTSGKPARKRKTKDTARPDDAAKRVLVVEDSPEQATILARGLRDHLADVEIDVALSGEEGLVMLEVNRYGAVVVDVGLRGIGGATFVREASRKHPAIAAVLVSGHAPDRLDEIARSCGAIASFSKPLDVDEIVNAIGPHLQ